MRVFSERFTLPMRHCKEDQEMNADTTSAREGGALKEALDTGVGKEADMTFPQHESDVDFEDVVIPGLNASRHGLAIRSALKATNHLTLAGTTKPNND